MSFVLPKLPYSYDAMEPYIDAKTMEIHYTKHHQTYVDNLNKALEKYPELQKKTVEELVKNFNSLPQEIKTTVRNNGGGHYNHSLFWLYMKKNGGGQPKSSMLNEINKSFGNFGQFQEQFNAAAKSVFGSGWAWLVLDQQGNLAIKTTANQDNPITDNNKPILGLDVWEHAYYLKYQNKRPDYINAWWHVINWDYIEDSWKNN